MCPEDNEVSRFGRERGLISYGVCPNRFGYLIKRVEALDGDRVDFSEDIVRVNGLPLKNSSRQQAIPARVDGAVELHHQALLMSEHPLSFDSRYFGPVSTDTLCTPLKPLYCMGVGIWPKADDHYTRSRKLIEKLKEGAAPLAEAFDAGGAVRPP